MRYNQTDQGIPSNTWRRIMVRALLLGAVAAVAGCAVGAVCGTLLCLAGGVPLSFALWWGLRGLCGGLAAGTILGAVSAIYHVDEPAPHALPAPGRKAPAPNGAVLAGRAAASWRNGVRLPN